MYTHHDIDELLALLLASVREALGRQFVGMYLYGSLAGGDFDPSASDIDFLVVTEGALAEKTIVELEAMHERIWKSGMKWGKKLEGAYIPREEIRRHDPNGLPSPTVNEGSFYLDRRGSDWIIQRHVIRESGVVLAGADPKELIDPLSPDDIRYAVLGVLNGWWFPMLDDPSRLRTRGAHYHSYAILTMCRALHAIEHGTIDSKPAAARWAQSKLGAPWSEAIERALEQRIDAAEHELFDEAVEMLRYVKSAVGGGEHPVT